VNAVPYVPPVSPGHQYLVTGSERELSSQFSGSAAPRQRYLLDVLGSTIVVDSPLIGRHQLRNVALAIAAAVELREKGFTQITAESIERGIRETHWPGRFQVIAPEAGGPEFVLDVAHNPAGAWALRSTLSAAFENRPITMVFGVLRDKAVSEIAEILFPLAEKVIVTHANNPRSATTEEIRQAAARMVTEISEAVDVTSAIGQARRSAGSGGLVLVTGSIYIVGEAMRTLGIRI
jgi:dihydrofolate synthase/folylpolyglutamate synthase